MTMDHVFRRLPGLGALLLITGAATVAAVSGVASLFYEGWGQPVWKWWPYLFPSFGLIVIGLLALRRPVAGAMLLLLAGLTSGALWARGQLPRGMLTTSELLTMLGLMLAPLAAAAVLLAIDARLRSRLPSSGKMSRHPWFARRWRRIVLVGVPLVSVAVLAARQLPELLARHDDGLRGARVIVSGSTRLVWAPSGPGWNSRSVAGDYLSWVDVARHGDPPLDRCAYLTDDGAALRDAPVRIWRLPSANEIIEALSRGGSLAGCTWDGKSPHAECRTPPDKETPLWAPDQAPIYYWSSQEASPGWAFAVNYTGGISVLPVSAEGLGVGFRCVKNAADDRRP